MQWQFLFFGAATVGFHFDKIMSVLRAHVRLKAILMVGLILVTLATMMLSYFWVLGWGVVESHHSSMTRDTYTSVRAWLDMWFTKSPLAIGRVVLSFIWFAGILAFIHLFIHFTEKYLRWLLLPLGTYSLTSYCIQAIVLIPMQMYIPLSGALLNTLIAFAAVLLVRVLVTQRHVHRILPQ